MPNDMTNGEQVKILKGIHTGKAATVIAHEGATRVLVVLAATTSIKRYSTESVEPVAQPAPAPTPSPSPPAPSPAPGWTKLTVWRQAGSAPLSDSVAASRIKATPENRPANATANAYIPSAAELNTFRTGERDRYNRTATDQSRHTAYVTGGFAGTTDEIIQWAAHKWGIPEDWARAALTLESRWTQFGGQGDRKTVADPSRYPSQSRIAGTSDVWQSLGITQVKWNHPDNNDAGIGTEPLRWKSTAFNLDYWGSAVRYYFDGLASSWQTTGYGAGQEWNSIGAWFQPYPWNNGGQQEYVGKVKAIVADKPWLRAGF